MDCFMTQELQLHLNGETGTGQRLVTRSKCAARASVASIPEMPSIHAKTVAAYLSSTERSPLFLRGEATAVLGSLPASCFDCAMTSPPYWGQRAYAGGGIGLEETWEQYVAHLLVVFGTVHRVLKPTGSFWLNIGDAYQRKTLLGLPWRVALAMVDEQGWILRNSIIWNKIKGGPDNAKDKLRNVHEHIFHFVKSDKYYYDVDAIRSKPRQSRIVNGTVISATGVSGVALPQANRTLDSVERGRESQGIQGS